MFEITKTVHKGCTFYGIRCDEKEIRIDDICSDVRAVENLCDNLERGNVSKLNIMDIIEDFIER